MDDLKIAFLSKYYGNDAIKGAVLVTDKATKPIEFRVTESVRPTKIQRTLYGEILYDYILVELIAVPLLGSLKEKPKLVLVQDEIFLEANSKQEIPVIQILKEEDKVYGKEKPIEEITSPSSKFPSLRITTSKGIAQKLTDVKRQLEELYVFRNLLEPFQRIQDVCEQDKT